MPVTHADVVNVLQPDEIDYPNAARHLSAEAVPILAEIAAGPDPGLASKAASLAGFLPGNAASVILPKAATHPNPVVRIAAAASIAHHAELLELADHLAKDPDEGVRRWASSSAHALRTQTPN
ncbi:hypothetical protein Rhe02_45770 [Rhizocola hellebori]|uniref:HEAT repeat domain-containing protein n=1 Tax=Rhizocola hellebori TaxID=1392758 RepID=A0A8J3Q9P0_9ACTN|nr:hypothetical protein [Rhizocola hellebori]GIH06510.1 hypothetical protein Rhe02_45770 [Rhizocola hellebori]